MESYGIIWNHIESYGIIWNHILWNYIIWNQLESNENQMKTIAQKNTFFPDLL